MTKSMRSWLVLAFAVGGTLLLATPQLQAQTGPVSRFLKHKQEEVAKLMRQDDDAKSKGSSDAATNDRLQSIIDGLLDYDELSRRSLEGHWDQHSQVEQREFVALLRQLVERNYRDNVRGTLSYHVDYQREESRDGFVGVFTVAKSKQNRRAPSISIDYRLHAKESGWAIFDIITDKVSLVDNYRNQFRRIIKKDGWPALLERMRAKVAEQNKKTKPA